MSAPISRYEQNRADQEARDALKRPWVSSHILTAYRWGMTVAEPAASIVLKLRCKKGKEDPVRIAERRGFAGLQRPQGSLIWMHGASVGETLSLLPIIERLVLRGMKVLITSGTVTSAHVLARRLPPGAFHQYIPLDVPRYIARFLEHWQPDLVLMAESDLWPNLISSVHRNRIPLVLVNARLSDRSYKRWKHFPQVAQAILSCFSLALAQTSADSERLSLLGLTHVGVTGNLKFDVPPPPADLEAVAILNGAISGRPVWAAASTHEGEEEQIIQVHRRLEARFPNLLTLIIPRHAERGHNIMMMLPSRGLKGAQRSRGDALTRDINVYVADTMGEMGLFYRISALVFMGGSLVEHGGQNPIEPAKLGAGLIHGAHVFNFKDVYAALLRNNGAIAVSDVNGLTHAVAHLLGEPSALRNLSRSAQTVVSDLGGAVERTMQSLEPYLMSLKISTRS